MCIVLASTAHPAYALVVIDNRDEYVLRPTSRPHWWRAGHQDILSSRDLQRAEKGTWLGVTKQGNFAVLTNYRETHTDEHLVQGSRSRGGMVTAWLTAAEHESTSDFVHRLFSGDGVQGVGGFSLLCGKLRKRGAAGKASDIDPFAIVSNRCGTIEEVPWVAERRGEAYGLSNTSYMDPVAWPKVETGKEKLLQAIEEATAKQLSEDKFVQKLFEILDTNTMPPRNGESFEEYLSQLRKSIFIPPINSAEPAEQTPKPRNVSEAQQRESDNEAMEELEDSERPSSSAPQNSSAIYGTQRQTIMLVDWDGKVTFIERSLWDEQGNPIARGEGDVSFTFQIDG